MNKNVGKAVFSMLQMTVAGILFIFRKESFSKKEKL